MCHSGCQLSKLKYNIYKVTTNVLQEDFKTFYRHFKVYVIILLQKTYSEESMIPGVLIICVVWMVVEGREGGRKEDGREEGK